jgi:hypothetical protein
MAAITMETIKIGRVTYEVKSGDYILDNGSCHQFIAGDGRVLKHKDFTSYTSLVMPATLVKKIPFIRMTKVNSKLSGIDCVKWYF